MTNNPHTNATPDGEPRSPTQTDSNGNMAREQGDMATSCRLRKAPAYQEYAADILASTQYRLMGLRERGLWDTMRKECWVNGSLPVERSKLARLLNVHFDELSEALTPEVLSFFEMRGTQLRCPELDNYRVTLEAKRLAMVAGGAKGGKRTQEHIKSQATLEGKPKPLSRREMQGIQKTGDQLSNERQEFSEAHLEWVADYEGKQA